MSEELEPRYDHKAVEEKVYRQWEESGYFNPDKLPVPKSSKLKAKSFCIIMPPPNANAPLHMGHAVFVTLQDIMIRFERMRGKKALWLPGADHAGFETQVVFDKKLEKEGRNSDALRGRSPDTESRRGSFQIERDPSTRLRVVPSLSRDETLWKEMWDFTQQNKRIMENQLRRLGASCDWSREKFTLDPDIIKIVYETFEKLYKDGLLYRDIRVVNWCTKHKTALSDLEVKYVERKDPLYYIKYGPLTLATVRPETKFGDTAIAVNPKDKRYQKYIGKEIEAEGVLGRVKFKVIADEAVDPKFGTGVVKVTPAHDPADFEIWQRHKDEIPGPKVVIDEDGRLTGESGPFKGLKVAEAREKVAAAMKEKGILEKVEPDYLHQVATCYKCGTTLEPLPKMQWFIKTAPLAKPASEAVKKGKIKFYPDRSKKVYLHWLKNIRDWNISRQIVWGIRIPAWYCLGCGEPKINLAIKAKWFLIRHAQSQWNKEGKTQGWVNEENPLSEEGILQTEQIAKILRDKSIDLVISSPLRRCRETAEIISKATGAELIFDKKLIERNMTVWEGMKKEERDKLYGHIVSSYTGKPPGGESYEDVEKRVWESFVHHKKTHHHKNIAIVSHGAAVRMLLKRIKKLDFPEAKAIKISNAFIAELGIGEPCKKCGGDLYEQDPDVFDTWFSSGQWPYATLLASGRRNQKSEIRNKKPSWTTDDFETFYPTDVMETGYDILFFWVTRMVMLGLYRTGKVPFKTVYLHGLVRDKDRQKMSKSKGNVIDPLGVAETYGSDAVRLSLVIGSTPGNDLALSEDKIRGYRNFATKAWNIARFILINKPLAISQKPLATKEDIKYLTELKKLKTIITKHLEKFEFHLAGEKLYHYIWHTFADKIIEAAKPRLKSGDAAAYQTLEAILLECLKMLHPFMPFITEEIYQKFLPAEARAKAGRPGKLLMIEKW